MTAIIAALAAVPRWVWKLLAVLLFAWLAYSWAYERGAASREAEIDQWRAAAKAGVEANTANQATIADLRRVNADWAKKCTFDPAASGEAANKAAENRDALPRDDQRRQEERETMIYDRDQTAAEWGRTSVPAAVADRLRR